MTTINDIVEQLGVKLIDVFQFYVSVQEVNDESKELMRQAIEEVRKINMIMDTKYSYRANRPIDLLLSKSSSKSTSEKKMSI